MSSTSSAKTSAANFGGLTFETPGDDESGLLTEAQNRTKRAEEYELKVGKFLGGLVKPMAQSPNMYADAATLLQHGPLFASKAGDLADKDERVRKGIDFITSGTDNAYLAFAMVALPMFAQIIRNHENAEVRAERKFHLPFTKKYFRIPFKLRFKLQNPFLRGMTNDPEVLSAAWFSNPEVLKQLGGQVAWSANGHGSSVPKA